LIVHDWSDHCPNYLRGGYTNGKKQFADVAAKERAKTVAIATNLATDPSSLAIAGASEGVATNPIQSNPSQSNEGEGAKSFKTFVPPTVEEVAEYCRERGNDLDPEYFVDKYDGNGWMVGRTKMKCWKATIRTWEKNKFSEGRKKNSQPEPIFNQPIVQTFKPVDLRNMAAP
jgi:hypothetical protein